LQFQDEIASPLAYQLKELHDETAYFLLLKHSFDFLCKYFIPYCYGLKHSNLPLKRQVPDSHPDIVMIYRQKAQ